MSKMKKQIDENTKRLFEKLKEKPEERQLEVWDCNPAPSYFWFKEYEKEFESERD